MNKIVRRAIEFGFSHAGTLDAATLEVRQEVRDMCRADKCGRYGKNWMCPPKCATLKEQAVIVSCYKSGIIVQTTGNLEDDFDYETMLEAENQQKKLFAAFRDKLVLEYPGLLALGNGACTVCDICTCPDAPCRFPDMAVSSMEAYGLIVSDAAEKNGLKYYYGPRTITYTGCFLLF